MQGEAPASRTVLAAQNLTRHYRKGEAGIQGIDLTVPAGGTLALIGRSGSGKTTLLRTLAGLETADTGSITERPSPLGYVFQQPSLLPWRTISENVALPLELQGIDPDQRRRIAAELLDEVGLAQEADQRPSELSVGMQMRASLARSLTTRPSLLLLDEPFAAIDAIGREELQERLQSLQSRHGFACVVVTHSIEEALFLGDRVQVLVGAPGTTAEVLTNPSRGQRDPAVRSSLEAHLRQHLHADG